VSLIKIYIDEDAMDSDLVAALRHRGVTVITPLDAGLTEKPDEEQLAFATEGGCVLYTFNVSDFYRLHTEWVIAGREHAGMILAPQQTGLWGRLSTCGRLAIGPMEACGTCA
jgi:hypothetical protein